MKTIQLFVPDTFTDEQVKSLTQKFFNQIELEIRNTVVIPQTEIERVETEIAEVKLAVEQDKIEQLAKSEIIEEVPNINPIL